jgi:hypothetical protein
MQHSSLRSASGLGRFKTFRQKRFKIKTEGSEPHTNLRHCGSNSPSIHRIEVASLRITEAGREALAKLR